MNPLSLIEEKKPQRQLVVMTQEEYDLDCMRRENRFIQILQRMFEGKLYEEDEWIPLSKATKYVDMTAEGIRNWISQSVKNNTGLWVEKKHGKDGNFMYSGNKILVSSNFLKSQINISEPVMKVVRG